MNKDPAPDKLGAAATASKNATAIAAAVSGLLGIIVGAMGFAFVVRDELAIWAQIKEVHKNENTRSGAVLYDHTALSKDEIDEIRMALGLPELLPNFDEFARTADLWNDAQLEGKLTELGFVKFGDKLVIASEYLDWTLQGRQDGAGTFMYSKRPAYENSDEWYLRKSN